MAAQDTGPTIQRVQRELSGWLEELFRRWQPEKLDGPKVVRDGVHQFIWLERHEVAILDTPLLQRLRHIHQTALAFLVYPGANHNRLEHSVGMLEVSQRMLDALGRRRTVPEETRIHVRLASLLHDVGHVLFSHLGEGVLERRFRATIEDLHREPYKGRRWYFNGVPLGELLGFLIITSDYFQQQLEEHVFRPYGTSTKDYQLTNVSLERCGRMIIGKPDPGEERWAADIVNGSFDADKLDYLMRDCHYTGVQAEVDTSRLVHSLGVVDGGGDWNGALGVNSVAMNHLEQILMAKLMLYTAIYHHHKVRALEMMFRSFYEKLDEANEPSPLLPESIPRLFQISEHDFFVNGRAVPGVGAIVEAIEGRRLLKRCLVLDRSTVTEDSWPTLQVLETDLKDPNFQRLMREEAYGQLPASAQTDISDLWIDMPPPPDVDKEAALCPVIVAPGHVLPLSKMFPADDWVRSYVANKRRGHVFYNAERAKREQVASVVEQMLKDLGITLLPLARSLALKE